MTKLLEWLAALAAIVGVWLALIAGKVGGDFVAQRPLLVYSLPLLVLAFGAYAAAVVLYRTFTFNTCARAAAELQDEIAAAREDLLRKGYVFQS